MKIGICKVYSTDKGIGFGPITTEAQIGTNPFAIENVDWTNPTSCAGTTRAPEFCGTLTLPTYHQLRVLKS